MTPEREARIRTVLDKRQENLVVVLENVFDPHNISAVMRTCDAVGVQYLYVLNTRIPRHKKWGAKSSSSAADWLTVRQYEDAAECFGMVRRRDRLSGVFHQRRFWIEKIHVAGRAFHETPDDGFGTRWNVRLLRRERVYGGGVRILIEHGGERNGRKSAACVGEKLPAARHVPMMLELV